MYSLNAVEKHDGTISINLDRARHDGRWKRLGFVS